MSMEPNELDKQFDELNEEINSQVESEEAKEHDENAPEATEETSEVSEDPGSDTDDSEAVESKEEAPATIEVSPEEKQAEFLDQFEVEEEFTPEAQLKQAEEVVENKEKEFKERDHWEGLPTGGHFTGIYKATPEQINQYVSELREQGQDHAATQVSQAYTEYQNRVVKINKEFEDIKKEKESIGDFRNQVEWNQVEKSWKENVDGLDPHLNEIAAYINRESSSNPAFAASLDTQEGKHKAVFKAYKALGLGKKISEKRGKAEIKKPAAPDNNATSKRVLPQKPKEFTRKQIAEMSVEEFAKNEPAINEAMAKGLIK